MSEKCHNRKSRLLFDRLVLLCEQRCTTLKAEAPRSLEIEDKPKG
jgi:hypothetical protein